MSITEIQVSINDYASFDWQILIAEVSDRTCDKYRQILGEATNTVDAVNQKNVLSLLSALSSMMLDPDSEQPFRPLFEFADRRGIIVDDFTDEQIGVFRQLAPDVNDPELRARIADVVWIRKRDFRLAEIAIGAYLQSANNLDDSEHRYFFPQRVTRALGLAASLGKGSLFEEVISFIESSIRKHVDLSDWQFAYSELMELLLKYRRGEFAQNADICNQIAKYFESNQAWFMARRYWELQSKWEILSNAPENARDASLRAAETYVQEAQEAIQKRNPPSYLVAAEMLRHAVESLRRLSETKSRQNELHTLLLQYQEKSLEEFGKISSETIDLTGAVRDTIDRVSGKTLKDAILILALICSPPRVSELEDAVKGIFEHSPLMAILSSTRSDDRGRYIKRRPSMMDNDSDQAKVALSIEMFGYAVQLRSLYVTGFINPARRQILREHYLHLNSLLPFVTNNPFVPEGRELIFAQGLQKGFNGDFVVSSHLLIPQIENSLRYLLNQRGVITSSLTTNGIQEDFDLNRLLYMQETREMVGEDILFDLKGLLTEAAGSNLRNRLAHGLISRNELFSTESIYLWWLTLRLCCWPILHAINEERNVSREQNQ